MFLKWLNLANKEKLFYDLYATGLAHFSYVLTIYYLIVLPKYKSTVVIHGSQILQIILKEMEIPSVSEGLP